MKEFKEKYYCMSVEEGVDSICVRTNCDTDWSHVSMLTNDEDNGTITIRSKAMAEQLHFMLGQMLNL